MIGFCLVKQDDGPLRWKVVPKLPSPLNLKVEQWIELVSLLKRNDVLAVLRVFCNSVIVAEMKCHISLLLLVARPVQNNCDLQR